MENIEFKRVLIWSGWWRLSHAAIGLSVCALLATGGLIAQSPSLAASALDVHYLAAAVLSFGLIVRISLMLFSAKPHERLAGMVPTAAEFSAMGKTLLFYLTLGKAGLPRWYAHNPLWKPGYLLLYPVLVLLVLSGSAMSSTDIVLGFYLPSVHGFWAQFVLWFSVLHILSVCVHDFSNKTADVSAVINGYRLYLMDRSAARFVPEPGVQRVSLDAFSKKQ
ncbi:MAG: cytochrome b/b6 domain-containing protein [Gammaproteobacteria bacterium]